MRIIVTGFFILLAINSFAFDVVNRENGKGKVFDNPDLGETVIELAGLAVGNAKKHSVALVDFKPYGGQSSWHFHKETEESYFVIKGEGLVTLGDQQKIIKAGDLIVIPLNTEHHIINNGPETLTLLVTAGGPWQYSDMYPVKK